MSLFAGLLPWEQANSSDERRLIVLSQTREVGVTGIGKSRFKCHAAR